MQPHKPAPPKMMLALDKSKPKPAAPFPKPSTTAAPAISHQPIVSKRSVAQLASAQPTKSNQIKYPVPAPAANQPLGPKAGVKPAATSQPRTLAKPPSVSVMAKQQPARAFSDDGPISLSASALGAMGPASKMRIICLQDMTASESPSDQLLVEVSGCVDSIEKDAPGVPIWKIIVSDLSANTAEVEYWPQGDEPADRIGVGSSYRFIGRIAKAATGQSKLVAIAIKECTGEEEVLMSALQKAVNAKKNEL